MRRKRITTTTDHNPDGWPLAPYDHGYPGVHRCGSILARTIDGQRACQQIAVWRIRTRGRNFQRTGYYCDSDLPDDDGPAAA
ncbi:hypothetical protein [Nonomuraea jiangxiensis]|uniref:Uncharacterized protein n=1 Tax=Nonomuraea jiangxiensis TaxID=633440 RepID=A0A1G8XU38_9ACTN|nr:hypothetical protein [Nonomuraea jiangxiensis]SDJ93976.1 hypothetical protein SAMN05421869_11374 [Nonomuraea jiangxiensis]